ncbi:hypothetical protein EPYR_03772 [Erwinia pyrifoliae DSM 12163]|nr:hypothetical protein EPYR_03772 [Erwinia pyrifoliae DSM 12163]
MAQGKQLTQATCEAELTPDAGRPAKPRSSWHISPARRCHRDPPAAPFEKDKVALSGVI